MYTNSMMNGLTLLLTQFLISGLQALIFSGSAARLDTSQTISKSGWSYVQNWDFKSTNAKPGLFLKGLTVDERKSTFSINKPGAYYLSYNLILKTDAKEKFVGAVILEKDVLSGAVLKSIGDSNATTLELTGAGVIRLTAFNSISVGVHFNKTNSISSTASIQPGSTFTVTLVTTAGAVPGFSFTLERDFIVEASRMKELSDWSTRMKGAFHISVGFLPARSYVQAICDGIYMFSVNLILKGTNGAASVFKLFVNQYVLREIEITFEGSKIQMLNIQKVMNLYKSDIVKLSISARKNDIQILTESTYSMILVNKVSQHTTGFSTRLKSNFSVVTANKKETISGWPTDYNDVTEFKSPSTFSQLVNKKDFSAPNRGIYLITVNLRIKWESVAGTALNVSIYSQPALFTLVQRTISHHGHSNQTGISLSTAAELERTDAVSVTIELQQGKALVLPGSSFSAIQLPIYYPGMLSRLTSGHKFSTTGWTFITNWKTDQIEGGYDFLNSVNFVSGAYRIPNEGLYLVSANIIVTDSEVVEALVSINKDLNVENGIFTKVGNPATSMTINVEGVMQLKKSDQVYIAVNSPSDTDWSIKGNTGLSVAYIGKSSHAFRAQTTATTKVSKIGWTNITNWQTKLQVGSSFIMSSGKFITPVSGVYHLAANVILGNADSSLFGSQYGLAVLVNGVRSKGLNAHKSGPETTPSLRRYYPLCLSGSFRIKKGDVVTLAVYTSNDNDYNILELSSWSLLLLTENTDTSQIGFSMSKNVQQNFIGTESNTWSAIDNWKTVANAVGSFYTPSMIHFDDGKSVTIQMTGFYLISANIYIQSEKLPSVMKLALFIERELQQNGITYENNLKWKAFTMHFSGVAFLMQGDTIQLMISCSSKFDGLMILKDSGFSMVMLPIAERFPGFSLLSMKQHKNIPISVPLSVWSADNNAASFAFTSGERYNKTSGIFHVRNAGYYLASMNLFLETDGPETVNMSATMQYGSNADTFLLKLKNSSVLSISSTILKKLEVGNTIYVTTNVTSGNAAFNLSASLGSRISLQKGSSFSVIHFPLDTTATAISEAEYAKDYVYSTPGDVELADWSIQGQSDRTAAIFRAQTDGIYFLSLNLKLINLLGSVTFYFNTNRGTMATSTITCKTSCQEYITLNNFVRLLVGDRISVYVKINANSRFTIAKGSKRLITFIRPFSQEVGLGIRIHNSSLVAETSNSWRQLYKYSLGNNTHGTFDARGNYSSFEGMIIPATGAYQVVINLIVRFSSTKKSIGTVEFVVSRDGDVSTTSGLYAKKHIEAGQISTMNMISSVIIPKWTKLRLMIRSDVDIYIQEGSTLSLVYIDSIINEMCIDEGPTMGDSLKPAYVASAIVGEERKWQCVAFGNRSPQYHWRKDDKTIQKSNEWLQLNGFLNDTGTYQCVASINGIMAESNKIKVQIYDVDECFYGNHTCDKYAKCTNNLGSFTCRCKSGFYGNGYQCNDTNECETGTHNCAKNSICTNLPGSFNCSCREGFIGNGVDYCTDVDECNLISMKGICGSRATCGNVPGSYLCTCNKGWTGIGANCSDINECALSIHNCDRNANCNNTNGTYTCSCKDGFSGNGYSGNCTDINECLLLSQPTKSPIKNGTLKIFCHKHADCVNSDGLYGCKCRTGFTGNGTHCKDINECELGAQSINCASNADCVNSIGSYRCQCRSGYTGDGVQCLDLDECKTKTFTCDSLANCTNTYGSYTCSCPKGYLGDGKVCSASSGFGQSTDPCVNDKSSLTCICKDSKTRDQNILCNGLFVAIIILFVVAVIVILFAVKYVKSRKNIKIGPAKVSKAKYIEMEDESEL